MANRIYSTNSLKGLNEWLMELTQLVYHVSVRNIWTTEQSIGDIKETTYYVWVTGEVRRIKKPPKGV